MDIDLTRTFLAIARHGSFIAAAERLHITQTAITARIQKLESHLNSTLFVRNRAGARLTPDGEAFLVYANQMQQTWEAAQRNLPLPEGFDRVLRIGADVSLCNPLMLHWVGLMRRHIDQHAVHAEVHDAAYLLRQLEIGALDAALVYQPHYWPGLQVEQLLEEKLIMVQVRDRDPYVYIDWGEAFRQQHDRAWPELTRPSVSFNLGPLALQYLLENGGSGYFRTRVVQSYLDKGVMTRVPRAPEFSYPTYLVYARERDCPALQDAFALLRAFLRDDPDWSQRWDPAL
ncbi:LysR family transcriptional regulator [Pseudomonas sp. DTU_2021_1001937_2_SI_NGA_ILE_001]|uniref:LysR family transcriptional regulator n=1 Tax=Pseudomonas sp. DTU_2021_1001937_2_SI_NGA_ILE_001 TaxID=3077589 RepID=UPI0028FC21B4|nr:LysR family transcriptional regulator [Pseudomonas sp. DTU_2021_1001937_2_SI_NGA_ILE_001]WNW12427.1 LysR family transcriptional regulator [Pseudomonas sp. DTU_2021_1001937_2_SI_NGA_ILE_001]